MIYVDAGLFDQTGLYKNNTTDSGYTGAIGYPSKNRYYAITFYQNARYWQ